MTTWQTLRKFFEPVYQYPRDYFWNSVEAILISGYTIFGLEITRKIIIAIQGQDREKLYELLTIFVVLSIALTISRFLLYKKGWSPIMHNGIMRSIKVYMEKFVYSEGSTIEKIGTGKFLTTIDKGLHDWYDLLFELTFKAFINVSLIFYAIYVIFQISPIAGILSIILFILSGVVGTIANFWMKDKRNLRREAYKEALHTISIMIMSRNEILQNSSLFDTFIARARLLLTHAREYHHVVVLGFLVMEEFPRLMVLVIRIGLYIFIANMLWEGRGSFADFAIFITIIAIAEKALNEFMNLMRDALRLFSFIDLLWQTFDNLPPIRGYSTGNIFSPDMQKDIELHNLDFGYGENHIFSDFSLTIKRGQKTALVGASGGGKTTLMKLIAGYLHPESGSISLMGNVLSETALKSYYPHIGYLTQDPSVFDATIRENLVSAISSVSVMSTESSDSVTTTRHPSQKDSGIEQDFSHHHPQKQDDSVRNDKKKQGFSLRSAPLEMTDTLEQEQKLTEALRLAHCDFVFDLEHGLDTEIGERGVRLSGGQKQRLAIAKIFLKDPEIILLDEPTSALDSFSEEQITKALDELFRGRTVIVIAHRLQTVKKADDIIVIEGGNIVERGDHDELVAKRGIYHRMLELQSGF